MRDVPVVKHTRLGWQRTGGSREGGKRQSRTGHGISMAAEASGKHADTSAACVLLTKTSNCNEEVGLAACVSAVAHWQHDVEGGTDIHAEGITMPHPRAKTHLNIGRQKLSGSAMSTINCAPAACRHTRHNTTHTHAAQQV